MGNSSTPAHKQGQIVPMVVVGGNKNSPTGTSERQDGAAPIYDPLHWSQQDVSVEDQWFSGLSGMPTSFGQNGFMGPPDPGTIVWALRDAGQPGGSILGIQNTVHKGSDGAGGGGSDFMNGPIIKAAKSEKIPVKIPPEIEEKEERGAKIRKIKEKGEQHSLDMLDGLPSHGALFQMTGFKLPEMKNIPTAKQKNDKMMNNNMMDQLKGQIMSMSQMFKGLSSKGGGGGGGGSGGGGTGGGGTGTGNTYIQDIHSKVPPHVSTAINSLSKLVQGLDTSAGVEFPTGGVVHEDTYLNNSANLISQCQTVDDLMNVMQRLQWDESLFGQEKLEPVEYVIDTAHGPAKQIVAFDGTIEVKYDANTMNNMNNWANVVSSNTGSPGAGSSPPSSGGGGGGSGSMMQQMFGKSSKIMQEMFKRLAPQQEKEAKKMHEKLNQSQPAKKMNDIFRQTAEGGEPLKKDYYKSDAGGDQSSFQFN